jgi:hypothetical protein
MIPKHILSLFHEVYNTPCEEGLSATCLTIDSENIRNLILCFILVEKFHQLIANPTQKVVSPDLLGQFLLVARVFVYEKRIRVDLQESVERHNLLDAQIGLLQRINGLIYWQTDGLSLEFAVILIVEIDVPVGLSLCVHIHIYLPGLLVLFGVVHDPRRQIHVVPEDRKFFPTTARSNDSRKDLSCGDTHVAPSIFYLLELSSDVDSCQNGSRCIIFMREGTEAPDADQRGAFIIHDKLV